ncbi:PEP-CTERM sorting domain-containing protein [Duganella rivi]|uniref:PEP-CTERM sorting domain-containing protein n=1 Tax=Duganella rivi TaxID=2666083 RepID=UPI001E2F5716|nr:PEP-CTERM sorting domain-containing protein [Duganella rivi]
MLQASVAAAMLCAASAQATTIIDFDKATVENGQLSHVVAAWVGNTYVEDGFQLQSSGWPINELVVADLTYNAGSYSMGTTALDTVTLTNAASNPFSLNSINLLRPLGVGNYKITFTGTKADSSVVTQDFTFTNLTWNTVTFGANFSNLTSVTWSEGSPLPFGRVYVFDNISVTAVPEPGTYAMLLAGLGLVGWARRRKQA